MSIIFFGITSESHIANNIDNWISIAGTPDIFSERDDHIAKYQTKLLNKYEVVTIDEALKRFPNANVWVTYPKVGYIPGMLAKKLPTNRIHFLEADLEYRKGCKYLGKFMLYREGSFSPCCVTGHMPSFKVSGSVKERVIKWQSVTTKLIEAAQLDSQNKCKNCHMLKSDFWRKSVRLNMLSLASNNRGDVCNFKCVYCFAQDSLKQTRDSKNGISAYEILQQLYEVPELDKEDLTLLISNGEFCANKHCDEMLDIFLKTNWKMDLTSNCSIYREKLESLMESGRVVSIVTSIDAGTRETFKKIKRNDMFDKVVENLRRYPLSKTRLHLKYIFLEGINDNEADINGFYDIAKEVNGIIMFSSNLTKPYTPKMRELALMIAKRAKADGVEISTGGNFLHPDDARFINENYKSAASPPLANQ